MSAAERDCEIGGRRLSLKRLDKVLFPARDGAPAITKGEVVDYYARIAETALPHLRGRPMSLQRCPDGIDDCFFQKQVPDHVPDWVARARLPAEQGEVDYLQLEEAAALVYMANQGAVALHAGLSRVDRPQRPDRLIFDLDPPGEDFDTVRWAAGALRVALEERDLPSFVMTTGSRGLHVVVPLDRSAGFDTARAFARGLAEELAEAHPERLTVEQRKDKRGRRLFLDVLRNAYGQTTIAPYSLRTKPGAPVATPLDWDELTAELRPDGWRLANIFRRLAQKPDPWAGIDAQAVQLG